MAPERIAPDAERALASFGAGAAGDLGGARASPSAKSSPLAADGAIFRARAVPILTREGYYMVRARRSPLPPRARALAPRPPRRRAPHIAHRLVARPRSPPLAAHTRSNLEESRVDHRPLLSPRFAPSHSLTSRR